MYIYVYCIDMISIFVERNDFKWRFVWTCFRYSGGRMSTTVSKVEEQISDASKPQQNGHERKNEELQLEDINDNNNDEVIFRDIFLRVGVSKCRTAKNRAACNHSRGGYRSRARDQYVRVESGGRIVCCKTASAISSYLRHIMNSIVVVSLWVIQGRIRIPDWIFFLIRLEINNASNANDDKAPLDFYAANDTWRFLCE